MASTTKATEWLRGRVKAVPSGDSLVIMGSPKAEIPPERTITLSSLIAPRLAHMGTGDQPFAWDSREFLRKLCIGKEVTFKVDYTVPSIGREFGSAFLGDKNVALLVVSAGWAKVRDQGEQKGEASPFLAEMLQLQEQAKQQGLGLWSVASGKPSIRELPPSAISNPSKFDAMSLLSTSKGRPMEAIVEQVRDGSTLRVYLLPEFQFVEVFVAGIQSPSMGRRAVAENVVETEITSDETNGDSSSESHVALTSAQNFAASSASIADVAPDPFGHEAKHFTEIRVLNRDVRIVLESVDKFSNLIGSVYYPDGESAKDLGLELVENGLAKYVEWSATLLEDNVKRQLKSAELQAKKLRLKIWINYVPPASNSKAIHDQNFTGKVIEVVSGDCVIVADDSIPFGNPSAERRVNLSSIRCPKIGNPRKDEKPVPYAWEAREFLRTRLIGQQVHVSIEYSRKVGLDEGQIAASGPADSRVMDFGSLFLACPVKDGDNASPAAPTPGGLQTGVNIAELMVARGFATVIRHRDFEERSNYYEVLLAAESHAISGKKGIHSCRDPPVVHVTDLTMASVEKARDFLQFLQKNRRMPAVVEYVLSGHNFKLLVPKETCSIAFSFSGVICPGSDEPYSEEAIALMRRKIMQRDVEIEVETVDRTGTFLGSLWESKTNMGVTLLEAGLARFQTSFGTDRIPDANLLLHAEQSAKRKKLRIWENYVEGEEISNGSSDERRQKEELKKVVTIQQQQIASLNPQEAPVIGAVNPKKGDFVLPQFSADDSCNQAMVREEPCTLWCYDQFLYDSTIAEEHDQVGEKSSVEKLKNETNPVIEIGHGISSDIVNQCKNVGKDTDDGGTCSGILVEAGYRDDDDKGIESVHKLACRPENVEADSSAINEKDGRLEDREFHFPNCSDEQCSKSITKEILEADHEVQSESDGEVDVEVLGSASDSDADDINFINAKVAKQFIEELERGSGGGDHSDIEGSHDHSQRIDGQIITDSDEEVDTDNEGDGKELFDSAALAALLKAATGESYDGGFRIRSQDSSRLFSIERPAGLGSSLRSSRPASFPNRANIFAPSHASGGESIDNLSEKEKKKLEKLHVIRIKFLRLVQRLGLSLDEPIAAKVLHRLAFVAGRQTGQLFSFDEAKKTAQQLESEGKDDLEFSVNILVLGKSGVGKSATINSIFGDQRAKIDPFGPATNSVKEINGVVDGVKIRVFDTPGLKTSLMEQTSNSGILTSVKKHTKKTPPDVILYVDRLDVQTRDLNDLPLLRTITNTLGVSIWRSAIVTLTHAASAPPDGPSGYPLSYEDFVAQRSQAVQQSIGQATESNHHLRMMGPSANPVSLVENHDLCRKSRGQKVLPNGQSWKPQLLLLCYSIKILAEASALAKPEEPFDHRNFFGFRVRSLPLPYILSSMLQSRTHPKLSAELGGVDNGDSDVDMADVLDSDNENEEEDDYDLLPPFKPLKKAQIAKLTKDQKKAYFEEYDYRVKLLQKKQWREELKRIREMKKMKEKDAVANEYGYSEDAGDAGVASPLAVPLPDMVVPPSFDCNNPGYRYRFLEPASQFQARPVLDAPGWDHDCGYGGINLEYNQAIVGRFPSVVSVQMLKDKKDFSISLDSSVSTKHGENGSSMAGFDIQTIGKQLAYIVRGETKFRNLKKNKTAAGVSVTFLGENVVSGFKVEDQIAFGKRYFLVGSAGTIRSQQESVYGANLELQRRELDYPIGQAQSTFGLSIIKFRGDLALGFNSLAQFSVGRGSKVAVRAGLNNKLNGHITLKTSSSELLSLALSSIIPFSIAIFNRLQRSDEIYSIYL